MFAKIIDLLWWDLVLKEIHGLEDAGKMLDVVWRASFWFEGHHKTGPGRGVDLCVCACEGVCVLECKCMHDLKGLYVGTCM